VSEQLAWFQAMSPAAELDGGAASMLRRTFPSLGRFLYPLLLAGFFGAYVGAAKLGIELPGAHGVVTPVWAPAGIALAALVLFGPSLWPAVALGALVANATSGESWAVAAGLAFGNTLEALVGAGLLRRVGFRPSLDRVRDVGALVLLAAAASTTIAATSGTTVLWLSGRLSESYGSNWFLWWSGDAMGDLVVAPLLLVWLTEPFWRPRRAELLEGAAQLGLLAIVCWLVFLHGYWHYPHLLFPLLVWASLRMYQRGAVTSSFVVAAFAIAGAVNGSTPIAKGSSTDVVQIEEGLLAAVIVSLLILGAVLSERAAAEAALERDITEAKRLNELRENILSTVSHELRTPLTSILGFAETLKERGADLDEELRAVIIGHLVEQSRRLEHLLSDLLDLDRMRHGVLAPSFRPTDVGALVADAAVRCAADGHPISVRAEPVVADVDAAKVERIVENLLANAVKHTPTGTGVLARVEREGAYVVIAVDDRGRGIREGEREAVFELFNRGDAYEGVPGAGIGLSLVAQFAALHGGRAWIEDHPGGGASFRVRLPIDQAEGAAERAMPDPGLVPA
jgi:signal transduction histidine kinase